jgi:hypothetical protein
MASCDSPLSPWQTADANHAVNIGYSNFTELVKSTNKHFSLTIPFVYIISVDLQSFEI